MDAGTEFTPQGSIEGISARALAHVSRLLNRPIETALDLAEVTRKGVSPELMTVLVDSGFNPAGSRLDCAAANAQSSTPKRSTAHRQ